MNNKLKSLLEYKTSDYNDNTVTEAALILKQLKDAFIKRNLNKCEEILINHSDMKWVNELNEYEKSDVAAILRELYIHYVDMEKCMQICLNNL